MAKVIVDKDVLSSVPSNLDSVVDDLLESARKQLQKAQDILLNNKKAKNNITSVKTISSLLEGTKDVSESVTATRSYTAKMVSLIEKYEAENKMTEKEMSNFADDLRGNGQILTAATGAVTVESVESSPWYSKMWKSIKGFTAGAWNLVKDVGATIATVFSSLIKGLAKLVEDVVDCVSYVGGALVTAGAWLGDLIFGTDTHEDIWNSVNGFVAKDWIGGAWDSFYKKTPVGKWLCNHSFLNPQGTAANVIAGGGEVLGIIAITAVFPPGGLAMAGTSAFGASSELSVQNGNSFVTTVLQGGVSSFVSVALMNGFGGKVSTKLASLGGKVTSKCSSLASKVAGSKVGTLLRKTGGMVTSGVKNLVEWIGNTGAARAVTKAGAKVVSGTKSLASKISKSKVGQLGGKVSSKVKSVLNRVVGISSKKVSTTTNAKAFRIRYTNGKGKDIIYKDGMKYVQKIAKDGTKSAIESRPMNAIEKIFHKSVANSGDTSLSKVGAKISKGKVARLATAGAGYGLAMDKSETPSNVDLNNDINMTEDPSNEVISNPSPSDTPKPNQSDSIEKAKKENNKDHQKDQQKKNSSKNVNKNSDSKNSVSSNSSNSASGSSSNSASASGSSSTNKSFNHKKNSSAKISKPKKSITSSKLVSKPLDDNIRSDHSQAQDIEKPISDVENKDVISNQVVQPADSPVEDTSKPENIPVENNPSNEAVATPVETPVESTQKESAPTPTYRSPSSDSTGAPVDKVVEAPIESTMEPSQTMEEGINIPNSGDVDIPEEDIVTTPTKKVTKTLDVDDTETTSSKHSGNIAIPIGLGLAGAGAAAVAGARYIKNKRNSEEYDEDYNDENNHLDYVSGSSDSAYMDDDYLGPSGSNYTDTTGLESLEDVTSDSFVPDDNAYTDASELENNDDNLEDDIVFNELNTN